MTKSLVVLHEAATEVNEAAAWYESQNPAAAVKFNDAFRFTLTKVAENPLQYQIIEADIRRAPLRRFPYGLLYVVEDDAIVILSCLHGSRDPARWQERPR